MVSVAIISSSSVGMTTTLCRMNDTVKEILLAITLALIMLSLVFIARECEREMEIAEVEAFPQLPNIDREAALELLEKGECLGGDIEEKHFSLWICKED